MKLLWVPLIFALGLGCSQAPVADAAVLVGAHDMVLVDKLLFTTSTDRDELRVLDLTARPGQAEGDRTWVRGPNPLEALSIPVLARPSALARDTHYEDVATITGTIPLGREVGGPWVYATSAGGSAISVVGGGPVADPTQLVEVQRIPTSAAVTASAGVSVSKDLSQLYYATFAGDNASLYRLDLPGTVAALKALDLSQLTGPSTTSIPFAFPGEVIVDLVVVPGIAGRGICDVAGTNCLIVATRAQQGRAGKVRLFDPVSQASRELRFPGPVRLLAIHAGTRLGSSIPGTPGALLAPGRRVFGILDEELCGGPECGGVIAVDTFTGEVALDFTGLPMLPITTGASLATGLSVVARGALLPLTGAILPVELPAAGVITTSNGSFIFFDADRLTSIDLNPEPPSVGVNNVVLYRANGQVNTEDGGVGGEPKYVAGPIPQEDGGVSITLASGAWHAEVIEIVVRGLIPGLEDRPADNSSELLLPPELLARVRVGDELVETGGCTRRVAEVTATAVKPAPAVCAASRYGIRAAGAEPYVVVGSSTGYLGRTGPDRTYPYFGSYFQRTADFNPAASTFSVALGPGDPSLEADSRWSIDVQAAEAPFILRVSSQSVGCSTNVASSVVWAVELPRPAVFSVFPSGNGIVEIDPLSASNRSDSPGNCWR